MQTRVCENGHEVGRDDLYYCPTCGSVELRVPGQPERVEVDQPTVPDAVAAESAARAVTAQRWLRDMLLWGAGTGVVAFFVIAISVGAESIFGIVVGLALGWAGTMLLLVPLGALAIHLAREASQG